MSYRDTHSITHTHSHNQHTFQVLDTVGRAALLGTEQGAIRVPFGDCAWRTTCASCTAAKDPYCGWCVDSRACVSSGECDSGSSWIHSLAPTTTCATPPATATVRVVTITARAAVVQVTPGSGDVVRCCPPLPSLSFASLWFVLCFHFLPLSSSFFFLILSVLCMRSIDVASLLHRVIF